MNAIRESLFDLLVNATLQIALFALAAAACSRFLAGAKAKYQHIFYLCVLLLCLIVPVGNTFWRMPATAHIVPALQASQQATGVSGHFLWNWSGHSQASFMPHLATGLQTAILFLWAAFAIYQLVHFARGLYRVHQLRREASPLSAAEAYALRCLIDIPDHVALLKASSLSDPVTIGTLHPAIVFPAQVLPGFEERELLAVLAHEYAHIRRRDFATHILSEALSLAVAWHPGVRYLLAKLAQTRELASDELAATHFAKPRLYARALVRLASLCLHASQGTAVGLGIFNAHNPENLEDRIMRLTEKTIPLTRAGLIGLALATTVTFGSGAALARTISLQTAATSAKSAQAFAGTWHWMFRNQSFATMTLVPHDSGFTGTVTESRISLDDNGELSQADPSPGVPPQSIAATMEGPALHVKVGDGFEFNVTLKDSTHAEIRPVGAPPNMKPILAERAQ